MKEKHNCQHHCLGQKSCVSLVPIFNHLNSEQMAEIMASVKTFSFKKGESLYNAGDQSDSLYIVSHGKVRIYRLSESGKEQLLRILEVGDFTGELALFKETIHESYAEAMVDTEICTIKRDSLHEILIKYPSISLKLLKEFSNRLEEAERQTTSFSTERVETRLASYLYECIDEDSDSKLIRLPMSKKDLASYLGTTPETISRKLYEMEDAGYIKQISNKEIEIINFKKILSI